MGLISTLNNIYKTLKDLYEVADNADRTLTKVKECLDRMENRQVLITIPAIRATAEMLKSTAEMLNKDMDAEKETPAKTAVLHRCRWTPKDITMLCQMHKEKASYKEIAETLGRSIQSINSKVRDLKLGKKRSNE